MRDNVFPPLGMTDTRFGDDHRAIVPNRASPYRKLGNGAMQNSTSNLEARGSSSLFSTLADMIKWASNFETRAVGEPEVWDMMLRPGVLNNGKTVGYGFGLSINETGGLRRVGHGGSWAGYLCQVTYYPDLHLAYVFLTTIGRTNAVSAAAVNGPCPCQKLGTSWCRC
jgi:CubicO group peptidase (beta-lactamase class C family)